MTLSGLLPNGIGLRLLRMPSGWLPNGMWLRLPNGLGLRLTLRKLLGWLPMLGLLASRASSCPVGAGGVVRPAEARERVRTGGAAMGAGAGAGARGAAAAGEEANPRIHESLVGGIATSALLAGIRDDLLYS